MQEPDLPDDLNFSLHYYDVSVLRVQCILAITGEWHGRNEEVVAHREELKEQVVAADQARNGDIAPVRVGNATGLITSIEPAGEIVRRIVAEAEAILRQRSQVLLND